MPEMVRYGLISTAEIGFYAHVPAARTSPNSELVAVSSRNLATAEAAAKKHDIPLAFGSYQEMIESDEIDAVINTLPNAMHHEWTIRAAEAGKHVICEKPFSVTMAEAREMVAAAEANNVVLIEGFTPRWNKQMRTVRRLIADGDIGEVIHLEVGLSFTMDDDREGRPGDPRGEGSLMGFGCYGVYALRYAMGVEPVLAMGLERKRPGVRFDTTANGLLQFPNGAVGHLFCCLEGPQKGLLEVFGTNGKIALDGVFTETPPVIVVRGEAEPEVMEMTSPDRFQVQLDEFSECILTSKQPEFPAEDALRNMASILALYESIDTGRAVAVEQI